MDAPETVLVIGFGVGNTTHAATLHPSIRRVEVADLSRDVLAHAGYFSGRQPRRAERPARGGLRQRRPAPSADAAAGLLRPDHAGAAAHRVRRRGCAVFDASSTRWRGRDSSRAASSASGCRPTRCLQRRRWRWCGRLSTSFRRRSCSPGAEADLLLVGTAGPAHRDRSGAADRGAGECAGGASRSAAARPGKRARDRRGVRRLGADAGGGDTGHRPGER